MQQPSIKILAISGSTKSSSTSLTLLNFIKNRFESEIDITIYNEIDQLPHFNPDIKKVPQNVLNFRDLIKQADGILFCTPEYVFSLPGSLKNAIEWQVSTTLFSEKPMALIVAAASGEKAFESLSLILTTLEAVLPDTSKLLIQGAKGKIDDKGPTVDGIVDQLGELMASFVSVIKAGESTPTKYLQINN